MSKMNIKLLDKNSLIIGFLILISVLIMLLIPKFWWTYEYTGDFISYSCRHFELKDIPRILYILSLGFLIFADIFYFVTSVKDNDNIISARFVLGLVASLLIILINTYGLFYVKKIPEYMMDFVWLSVHIILNLAILIGVIYHAQKIDLIDIDKPRFSLKNGIDRPFNLALILGSIIFIISLIIMFIPSFWLPKHFTIRFPITRSGDDEGYSFTFNLFEFVGFLYIIGLVALINSGICLIIYGIQKYQSLRKVGFGLGLRGGIFFSTLNIYGVIYFLIKIVSIPNQFLSWFGFIANVGFDVPPPPEKAFIIALISALASLDGYWKNIILTSSHLIFSIIALILVIYTYKKTYNLLN